MKNSTIQILIALALTACLLLLSDPFMYWMPEAATMIALLAAATLLCIFAGFVMREGAADEREALHRMNAGRVAYLTGLGVLTIALVVQGLQHDIDPWVALALAAMVLAKLAAHVYADRYQ